MAQTRAGIVDRRLVVVGLLFLLMAVRCEVAVERLSIEGHGVRAETSDGEILRAQAENLATRASEALELWSEAPGEVARFLSDQPIRTRSTLSFG